MLIDQKDYIKIIDVFPIPCIDIVIIYQGKVLLGKRKNNPYKGQWRIPGGRVYKGEEQYTAIQRLLKTETSLDLSEIPYTPKLLGVYDVIETGTSFSDTQVGHAICSTYMLEIGAESLKNIHPDPQNEVLEWFPLDHSIETKLKRVLQGFNLIKN